MRRDREEGEEGHFRRPETFDAACLCREPPPRDLSATGSRGLRTPRGRGEHSGGEHGELCERIANSRGDASRRVASRRVAPRRVACRIARG